MKSEFIVVGACLIIALIMMIAFVVASKEKKERRIFKDLPLKTYWSMVVASIVVAIAVYYLNPDSTKAIVVYYLILFLLPYVYLSNQKRKRDESLFNQLVMLCNNTSMLLKQGNSAYVSLTKAQEELDSKLQKDINELTTSLQEDKEVAYQVFSEFAKKYQYTIIKQFNILILQSHYESNFSIERMADIFQNDVERLMLDVKQNQTKRKMLRIQYIGLSVGCIAGEIYLFNNLSKSLSNVSYSNLSLIYIVVVIICLFFVDQYFNNHITKE